MLYLTISINKITRISYTNYIIQLVINQTDIKLVKYYIKKYTKSKAHFKALKRLFLYII